MSGWRVDESGRAAWTPHVGSIGAGRAESDDSLAVRLAGGTPELLSGTAHGKPASLAAG